jgi:response regulator RpfG family c-di-GMP phosphodiesterase
MAALIAGQIGLSDTQVSLIRRAAPLHDVGKIGIPDSVLLKLGKLTPRNSS